MRSSSGQPAAGNRQPHELAATHRLEWLSPLNAANQSIGILLPAILALALIAVPATAAEILDRIVAVVNGSVLTLSDVEAARRFGLIDAAEGDFRSAVERTIDRRLALIEAERYAPPEPSAARLDEAVAAARARFASDAAFEAALKETGLTIDQLRRHLRDDLRLRTYEQQRFGLAMQPTDDDLRAFFQANAERFRRGGVPAAYEDVRADVGAALVQERTAAAIREWLSGLRRRADIRILPQ